MPEPSPDCVAGKHGSCVGDGWDDAAGAFVGCPCACHDTCQECDGTGQVRRGPDLLACSECAS